MNKRIIFASLFVILLIAAAIITFFIFDDSCRSYPAKLKVCQEFACKYEHPFDSIDEMMEKKILGFEGDLCLTTEEVAGPTERLMVCRLTEEDRKAMAEYLSLLQNGKVRSLEMSFDTKTGDSHSFIEINGKKMEDPLQKALNSGACNIESR